MFRGGESVAYKIRPVLFLFPSGLLAATKTFSKFFEYDFNNVPKLLKILNYFTDSI